MSSLNQHVSVGSSDQADMPNIAFNAQKVANTLAGKNQVPESSTEIPKFWLTLAEKQSIEDDIKGGKPIMATPAYTKFLTTLLPNGLVEWAKYGLKKLSSEFPEYEIHNGIVRINHAGVIVIINWLSELFDRVVRLLGNGESKVGIIMHKCYFGFRDADNGALWSFGKAGYAWIYGDTGSIHYTGHHTTGHSGSDSISSWSGILWFPCFE